MKIPTLNPAARSKLYKCTREGNGHYLRIARVSHHPMDSGEYLYLDLSEARMLRNALMTMNLDSPDTTGLKP